MTYPNMDLQSLPAMIELRVGTDQAERALQLSFYQVWAGIQALNIISEQGIRPEAVINAGEEANFDSSLASLIAGLVAAMVYYDEIWSYVP